MTEKIWLRFNDELLTFIRSKVSDKMMADDILQEVFIKIHEKIYQLEDHSKLTSWLYQITRNAIVDYYRSSEKTLSEDHIVEQWPEDDTTLNSELLPHLKPFMDVLPPKYKDALEKTSYGALSQKEYAVELGLSYSATKSRVQRARTQLKRVFTDCCTIQSDKYGHIVDITKKDAACKC